MLLKRGKCLKVQTPALPVPLTPLLLHPEFLALDFPLIIARTSVFKAGTRVRLWATPVPSPHYVMSWPNTHGRILASHFQIPKFGRGTYNKTSSWPVTSDLHVRHGIVKLSTFCVYILPAVHFQTILRIALGNNAPYSEKCHLVTFCRHNVCQKSLETGE